MTTYRSGVLLLCVLLFLSGVLPATAGIPGDTNGDTVISEQELAAATLDYLNATDLKGPGGLDREELSLAAHNYRRQPYGQLIVAVSGNDYLIPDTSYIDQKGVPADSLIYEGPVTKLRPQDGGPKEYLGWLAERWECSPDAKTWTFYLVRNATWQDGVPFTSADVKFTCEYFKEHANADGPMGSYLVNSGVWNNVESVECPDEYTAIFHMKSCEPCFTADLATGPGIGIFPEHIWKDIDLPATYEDTAYIGTGPFKYESKISGTLSKLSAYDDYHGEQPYVDEIILKNYEDEDAEILALKKGDVDFISGEFGLSPKKAESLMNTPGVGICQIPSGGQAFEVAFSSDVYPANITGFRRALSHAVNRERVCWLVGAGARPTNTSFLIPALAGDQINPDANNRFDYDLDEAKRLLAEAGFNLTESDGKPVLLGPDGKQVEITIPLSGKASTNAVDQKIVAVLKEDWEGKLGIKIVDTPQVDSSVYLDWIARTAVHFDGMPGRWHEDIDRLDNFQRSPLGENYYHFDNATFNALITQLKNTADPEERKKIGFQLQEVLAEQVPCIPVFSQDAFMAYRSDRFVGWDSALLGGGGNIRLFSTVKPASAIVGERIA
ncbi:MAG: peptide/nickel transport system substrate-binding protein [Methanofollis sp.]|nr:peptide/nickel transport system substrate-binding protein [Methanofollis sp.]